MSEDKKTQEDFEIIGNMAGAIAKDFTNWLNVISGYAVSIKDSLIPRTRAHEDALLILEATKQAEALTKQLLSISRASAREEKAGSIALLNVSEAIEAAISYANTVITNQNVTIKYKEHNGPLYIEADYNQLVDCLSHLFFNAADAMPDGGIINVDSSEKPLNGEPFVIIRVRDTGVGIPKEIMDRIFDPFFSTKEEKTSMGLGLPVVRTFVEQWSGEIKVRSQPGKGASFRIFIPPSAETKKLKRKINTAGDNVILIIDNNEDVLTSIKDILSKDGHKAIAFSDSEEALAYHSKNYSKVSLVILDLIMPGKKAKEIMRSIQKIDVSTSIIIISGFSKDYTKNHIGRGTWWFLQKPIFNDTLLSVIQEVLDEKALDEPAQNLSIA